MRSSATAAGGDLGDLHGGGLLELEHRHVVVDELLQGGADVLELDGLVADVVDGADMAPQDGAGLLGVGAEIAAEGGQGLFGAQHAGEEVDGLVGGLEEAVRLGLDGQGDGPAGALAQAMQVDGEAADVGGVRLHHVGPVTRGLNPRGGLWMEGLTLGAATSARMSATCMV